MAFTRVRSMVALLSLALALASQAARAAGCEVLLVTYGYNHGHDITEVPALAHVGRLDEVDWARWLRP